MQLGACWIDGRLDGRRSMCKTLATGQLSSDMALTRYQPRSGRKSKRKNAANSDSYLTADGGDKTESDDELPLLSRPVLAASELPPKYWFVLKIVKYARVTFTTLCKFDSLMNRLICGLRVWNSDGYSAGSVRIISTGLWFQHHPVRSGEFRRHWCLDQRLGSRWPQV